MDRTPDIFALLRRYTPHLPLDIVGLIREAGISYYEVPMPEDNSGRIEKRDGRYTIYVNSLEGPQRKRFTAAHEFAHYFLHRDLIGDGVHLDRLYNSQGYIETDGEIRPHHEVQANQLAADLLMPAIYLRKNYDRESDNYNQLAKKCLVSPAAMKVRLRSLGIRREN